MSKTETVLLEEIRRFGGSTAIDIARGLAGARRVSAANRLRARGLVTIEYPGIGPGTRSLTVRGV